MQANELLEMNEKEKSLLWEIFQYEEILDAHEEILLKDLRYYERRITELGRPERSIDIAILTIYMKHMKNIKTLLSNIYNKKETGHQHYLNQMNE